MLALPLLTAVLRGSLSWSAAWFSVAAIMGFLAHEPLLVVLGQRGSRLRREGGRAARNALLRRLVIAAIAMGAGIWLGEAVVRISSVALVAVGVIALGLSMQRAERSPAGVMVPWLAAAAAFPTAVASGWDPFYAGCAVMLWGSTGALAMASVRSLLPRRRSESGSLFEYLAILSSPVIAVILGYWAMKGQCPMGAALAALPPLAVCAGLVTLRPKPRWLRHVGWSLVVAQLVSLVLIVAL